MLGCGDFRSSRGGELIAAEAEMALHLRFGFVFLFSGLGRIEAFRDGSVRGRRAPDGENGSL